MTWRLKYGKDRRSSLRMDRPEYPGPAGAKQHDDRHKTLDKRIRVLRFIRFGEKLLRFCMATAALIPFSRWQNSPINAPISVARTITGKVNAFDNSPTDTNSQRAQPEY